jgi:hypothetical protein
MITFGEYQENDALNSIVAAIVLGFMFYFVFFAGQWYAQSKIVEVRCHVLETK